MNTTYQTFLKLIKRNYDTIILIVFFIVLYFILKKIIIITVVQTGSMEPTLNVGSTVLYDHYTYSKHSPERGDIVVFWSRENNEYFAKRIVALPGEEIRFIDGKVVINDHVLDESDYILPGIKTYEPERITFSVPEDCYFMLGDNRLYSNDSRYWQEPYINIEDIMGKYLLQINFSFQFDVCHSYPKDEIPLNIAVPTEKPEDSYLEYIIEDMRTKKYFNVKE